MTQREGRILRRGNQNERVGIYKYVTERSFDAYSWQTIENKQRFISQIMTGGDVPRVAEDIDKRSLTYAEIKAIATGDPRIMRKSEVDMEVSRLETLFAQYRHNRYRLEDRILKYIPAQIAECREKIDMLEKDSMWQDKHTTPDFTIKIGNQTFDNRKDAGTYLISLIEQYKEERDKLIGYYKGFQMLMSYNKEFGETTLTLKNSALPHVVSVSIGTELDPVGIVKRLDYQLSSIDQNIQDNAKRIADFEKEMKETKSELERPFEYADQLAALQKEQQALNLALNLDQNEEIIIAEAETEEENQESGHVPDDETEIA